MANQNDIYDSIIQSLQDQRSAVLDFQNKEKPKIVYRRVIKLDVARDENDPLEISYSFKSVYVDDSSDPSAVLYLRPNTKEEFQDLLRFKLGSVWNVDQLVVKSFLSWPAQPGKTITLIYLPNSRFDNGTSISVNSGGFSINEGSSFTNTNQTLTAGVTSLLATNLNRKVATVQNNTGASFWIGGATVSDTTPNRGIEIFDGKSFQWKNTSQLWAFSVAGGSVTILEEV